jgi:S-formylglutathione hydrolase FrmB
MDSLVAAGGPEMIVAMPDGDPYSFYTTFNLLLDAAGCRRLMVPDTASAATVQRDCVAWPHYDDYVAYDVVRHVDSKFRTVARREGRALAGLSMGGYGAITLALQYPAIFAAAASHSGVLSPLILAPDPFARRTVPSTAADSATSARLQTRWAPLFRVIFGTDSAGWLSRDPATLANRLKSAGRPLPALFADVGVADAYLPHSRAFVAALQASAIPIAYREWPGAHTWDYWRTHVGESLSWIGRQIGSAVAAPPAR